MKKNTFHKLFFLLSIMFFFFMFLLVEISEAITIPDFPSCVNPQGNLIVRYDDGIHYVPANTTPYQGSDLVYQVSSIAVMQCLCTVDGEGIQTNWWKTSSLDGEEIENLKNQGWIFVPDGSAWGLDPSPYFAKNISYLCKQSGGSGGGSSSSTVQTAVGEVLGLASTGNIKFIYTLFALGIIFLSTGILLKNFSLNNKK